MGKITTTGYHNGCRVTGAELMAGKDGKAPQVAVSFENQSGDYISLYGSLSDAAFKYTVEKLRNCGWTGTDISDLSECVGKIVDIKVVNDDYNGKTTQKVKSVFPHKEREHIAPADAKAIAAQYMGRIAALSIPSADPRPEPPPPSEADDEPCPF